MAVVVGDKLDEGVGVGLLFVGDDVSGARVDSA